MTLLEFSENTKYNSYVIAIGLFIVAVSTSIIKVTGNFVSSIFKLLGIIILIVALISLSNNLINLCNATDNIFFNTQLRNNVGIGSILCFVLITLILYSTYTIVF